MKALKIIVAVLVLAVALIFITGKTYLFKTVWYNFAAIDDYKHFTNDTVATARPQPWPVDFLALPYPDSLDRELTELKTVALVVIDSGTLRFERYWGGYGDSSFSGSFSMAKSIVSLLIGVAVREGRLSIDTPVRSFIPSVDPRVTIRDLLTMSSGSDWDESYANPFSATAELYYGSDAYAVATRVHTVVTPGTLHRYKSGDTQLLGIILQKAYGMSLASLASQKLWQPLGAEHPALWSNDHPGGFNKAYCCFNSNARDFARLGQLMLDSGCVHGVRLIDSAYWAASTRPCGIPDETGRSCDYYGYQWWLDPVHPGVFYARGILGQYIIVIPSKRRIIVRLGKKRSPVQVHTVTREVRDLVDWGLAI
ncbi:MAG TPA: serine hydrolase [Dinghuibacter sp.]|jgi:CubicO group peptidase (beta-lactamase class C family)|uniref:serine hydrolase domain-containing protein n=1 Tax=Dinghuibacter sp. TaxID=2024697 RepID=UPI002C8004DA|nr:serine hydrolase [Dinghuibacter sp.]HTJ10865.1 serine hydrolase [Dinghuibacter sp.]